MFFMQEWLIYNLMILSECPQTVTVYFDSDEELFSQDLNSTGDPEYCPPWYFRTGRHSSFINFAIFHLNVQDLTLAVPLRWRRGARC